MRAQKTLEPNAFINSVKLLKHVDGKAHGSAVAKNVDAIIDALKKKIETNSSKAVEEMRKNDVTQTAQLQQICRFHKRSRKTC